MQSLQRRRRGFPGPFALPCAASESFSWRLVFHVHVREIGYVAEGFGVAGEERLFAHEAVVDALAIDIEIPGREGPGHVAIDAGVGVDEPAPSPKKGMRSSMLQ